MIGNESRDAIHEALTAEGFDRKSRAGEILRYDGVIIVGGRKVLIALEFPCLHFTIFPKVYLLNAAAELPGVAAHLDSEDSVCYAAPGSIVLDRYNPAGTALLVLQRATATLASCVSGDANADIKGEFPQYWADKVCLTTIQHGAVDGPASLVVVPRDNAPQVTILTRDDAGLSVFPTVPRRERDRTKQPAYILHLDCEMDLPGGRRPPNTLESLFSWANDLQPELPRRLRAAIQNTHFINHAPTIFFVARNGCVGAELFLPTLTKRGVQRIQFKYKWMFENPAAVQVRRWSAFRFDLEFMLNRNLGGLPSLKGRKIVLVGCGTIGGHLARFLVQGGAGHVGTYPDEEKHIKPGELCLIDPERLEPGNIGRHLLGPGYLGRSKANALAEELLAQFPGARIRAIARSALDDVSLLTGADIVVDATGEEALSIAINSVALSLRPKGPDVLYIALLGNGAAAQALFVSGRSTTGACRKCLHPNLAEAAHFDPIADGWGAQLIPASCGESAFLPYGVAASAVAAGLASRMVMEWAAGQQAHTLRTLRVDPQATINVPDGSPAPFPGCPCCGRPTQTQTKATAE